MWFVEFAGKTVTSPTSHCLLRAAMTENIVEMGYVSYSRG